MNKRAVFLSGIAALLLLGVIWVTSPTIATVTEQETSGQVNGWTFVLALAATVVVVWVFFILSLRVTSQRPSGGGRRSASSSARSAQTEETDDPAVVWPVAISKPKGRGEVVTTYYPDDGTQPART